MRSYLLLLGQPGAGKGTQAERLSKTLGLPHVSSGDLFREHLKEETDLGRIARAFMDRGELVPDDVTVGMIRERLSRPDAEWGAVLDGFPRTPAQAEALDAMAAEFGGKVDAVLYIEVPDEVLVERLSGRLVCRDSGHIYHQAVNPPKVAGVCDVDGSPLYQRQDDRPETVRKRLEVYRRETAPLIAYYRKRSVLETIDGNRSIDEVAESILRSLPEKAD